MVNPYYQNIPVDSAADASTFANEYTWAVLDVVRKGGARGLTAIEVHAKVSKKMGTSVSTSMVYGVLKRLYEQGFVHRYFDNKAGAQRNAIGWIWGGNFVDPGYSNAVTSRLSPYMKRILFPVMLKYIQEAAEVLAEDAETKKWVPRVGPSEHCKRCHISHEANEFFSSLLDIALDEFTDSDEFKEYFERAGFGVETEEE
jgi:hypothetical protein